MESTYTKLDDNTLEISTPQSPIVTRITLAEARKNLATIQQKRDEANASYNLENTAYTEKMMEAQSIIDTCIANGLTEI